MTVYQTGVDKVTLMLSSEHDTPHVPNYFLRDESNGKKKPNTVLEYEETRSPQHSMERAMRGCAIRACTRRWPVQVFFTLVNLVVHNAWTLYKLVNESADASQMSKRSFILKLTDEILELCEEDASIESYDFDIDAPESSTDINSTSTKKRKSTGRHAKSCQIRQCNNNKAIDTCFKCKKACCGQCVFKKLIFCKNCV